MHFSISRTATLLGQQRDALRSLMPRDTYDCQPFEPHSKDFEISNSVYKARPPLRSLIKTKLGGRKGHATGTNKEELRKVAVPDNGNEAKHQSIWSNIVDNCLKAKIAIVKCGSRSLSNNNVSDERPDASVLQAAERHYNTTRAVQYRDMDLGSRREVIYADIFAYLSKGDQASDCDFDLSAWSSFHLGQGDDGSDEEAFGGMGNWESLQQCTSWPVWCGRSAHGTLYEPLPPLSIISENAQEDSSRPTTSRTDRKDFGEFLRRLQTGSSAASTSHSRNVSDLSAITLPSCEDGYHLSRAPARMGPPMLETIGTEYENGHLGFSHQPGVADAREELVDQSDVFEEIMCLQAPRYLEFEWYQVNDIHESTLDLDEQAANQPRNYEAQFHVDHEPRKSLCLHVEQPAGGDDHSFISTLPDESEVTTRSYGKFDAAFTQQVKDYSKLLDDLADPDATAQALELVSSRLSFYLNSNNNKSSSSSSSSSADVGFGRSVVRTDMSERRQHLDLSDLDAFLDDDEDSDSGYHVGSSAKVFACPVKPRPTPFSDLEQFIGDNHFDVDFEFDAGGPTEAAPVNGFTAPGLCL